jgi:DNA-binding MarR family transcriptional regulator
VDSLLLPRILPCIAQQRVAIIGVSSDRLSVITHLTTIAIGVRSCLCRKSSTESTMTVTRKLPDGDRDIVKRLQGALDQFTDLSATMPHQYIKAFLAVALEEGFGEYAQRAGVALSVMSRHLLDIGDRNRHMEDGYGLVTFRPNPMNLRTHEYTLTDKGRALLYRITRQFK